jgi:transketolase
MTTPLKAQRDVFIEEVTRRAQKDAGIYFVSADFGAPALDELRTRLPRQFIHSGISEQHMIDMAAGLSLSGKTVFVYAMSPFISLRCLEQLKCSLAVMQQRVCVLSVGVGLGYADSGPTHYSTEDLACLRSLNGVEILTPCDSASTRAIARHCCDSPAFRIVRMDRSPLADVHANFPQATVTRGVAEIAAGRDVCLLASGYMTHRAKQVAEKLAAKGVSAGIIDLFRIKPLPADLRGLLAQHRLVATLEEQCLAGGFGSAVLEYLSENRLAQRVLRFGLPERYFFENGGRDYLLSLAGLDAESVASGIQRELAAAA